MCKMRVCKTGKRHIWLNKNLVTKWTNFHSTILSWMHPGLYSGHHGSVRTWLQRPASSLSTHWLPMSHIVAALIKNRNSRHLSALAQNIPVVFFMSIKSCCFFFIFIFFFFLSWGFNNGSFLARHAVSRQSTLLGPTAGCAVLIINFADECRLCSPLIYFSLANVPMYIPAGASLCCCCCYVCDCMWAVMFERDSLPL